MRPMRYLRDFVYGAVTAFAVVAGATGADLSDRVVVILGVANLNADGFSMGVSNFLGARAEGQQRDRARRREVRHVVVGAVPLAVFIYDLLPFGGVRDPFAWSAGLTAVAFVTVGAFKARIVGRPWWRSGLETLLIGGAAASLAYVTGVLLEGIG
jgi:vacuolar iron transporter family protein